MSHSPLDKIQALDAIEKEIILCLQSAGNDYLCITSKRISINLFTFQVRVYRSLAKKNPVKKLPKITRNNS